MAPSRWRDYIARSSLHPHSVVWLTRLTDGNSVWVGSGASEMRNRRTDQLHAEVVSSFEQTLAVLDPDGTRIIDGEETGRRAAESVMGSAELWQDHLGAFYDSEGVRHLLSRGGKPVTRQAVSKRKNLLALKTGSGRSVFPVFQFRAGTPVAGLGAVLDVLSEEIVSRWSVASWLKTPNAELGHEAPIELLAEGNSKPVIDAAQRWAAVLLA